MHVAFLTTEYPPAVSGGIGTSIRTLARALVRLGHRVSVVGWGSNQQFDDRGVSVRLADRWSPARTGWLMNRLRLQRELRRMVHHEGLDVVEAPDWCGMSAGIRPGCPVMIRCNGSAVYFGDLLGQPVRASVKRAEWLALHQASAVAAVSRFAASRTQVLFGLNEPIELIPNSVDVTQFPATNLSEAQDGTILYLGTLALKKGVLDLCRAFNEIAARRRDARLVLVDRDSADRDHHLTSVWSTCAAALTAEAKARVEYLGPRPNHDVQDCIRRAVVCVFPSYAEALPVSWLEVMACGRPIVAYDIGWASELIADGEAGLLVPRGDVAGLAAATIRILDDPAMAPKLGAFARRRVEERFADGRVADISAAWYERAIARRCHPAAGL